MMGVAADILREIGHITGADNIIDLLRVKSWAIRYLGHGRDGRWIRANLYDNMFSGDWTDN